ncbi:MAG: hypothetical protein OXE44_05365 [Nitrospinae bacterium]|nr:hypothetical protein [Nitrospinota bacterium]
MEARRRKRRIERLKFWMPALLWLPAGMIAGEVLRAGSEEWVTAPFALVELLLAVPFGVPLALACRRLTRSGYPGPALVAWLALGAASVADLPGTLPVGVRAVLASLPVWVAVWRLTPRPRGPGFAPPSQRPESRGFRGPFR